MEKSSKITPLTDGNPGFCKEIIENKGQGGVTGGVGESILEELVALWSALNADARKTLLGFARGLAAKKLTKRKESFD